MKLPWIQPIVQPMHAPYNGYEAGVRIHDHDLALSYVLEHFPALLPSYGGLQLRERQGVLFTQGKMQFNHGWFVQGEAPPGGMLSKFKALLGTGAEQADIDLYFLHWVTDLAGAEGTPMGGAEKLALKFPHPVLTAFLWSMPYMSKLKAMSETDLVEQYLEAQWKFHLPDTEIPSDARAIALMRIMLMAQAQNNLELIEAFDDLPGADQQCLITELSRTGCMGQTFKRHVVAGGPAFLVYYSPALLQRNNKSKHDLTTALHTLCVVLRGARAVWPMSLKAQGSTVIIMIEALKSNDISFVVGNPASEARSVWVLLRDNNHEGTVCLCTATELNALYLEGSQFRVLDFTIQVPKEIAPKPASGDPKVKPLNLLEEEGDEGEGNRILVFTDMSTECDDECAILWLVA
eukprot:CAMPEP_0170623866 /NCGR_PEP_ID=MMETSP0224-20130122/29929_1 /TAXON_ID=285029 /ORGANISM="Togula jolla, Strain CCCM 725" /LENGTH=404 /DNA_ID=CAMNT_0010950353 /DNA_START=38 /DNA_END=1249 /DNA_ORIENTATION=-